MHSVVRCVGSIVLVYYTVQWTDRHL